MSTATVPHLPSYPVHIDADAAPVASRWLWLVKWLLALPHYIVLVFLWLAFGVLSIGAFFAILFTGRYPRAIFDFNVGVLRWSWRVTYYAYGALATDRYPPFTLAEVEDYPTHLQVDYPEHLSRGLVLVKWWLLAIPHYLVVGLLIGGSAWAAQDDERWRYVGSGGLVGLLAIIAAVVLAFTGTYPRPLYDLLLGLNRWVLRVAAYVALMTDQYPPFRLDMGPHEPDYAIVVPPHDSGGPGGTIAPVGPGSRAGGPGGPVGSPFSSGGPGGPVAAASPPGMSVAGPVRPGTPTRSGWTPGRTLSVVAGALLGMMALGSIVAGGALLVADRGLRDGGFVTAPTDTWRSGGYAAVLSNVLVQAPGSDQNLPGRFFGQVRLQATPTSAATPLFVGIARESDVSAYLSGVARTVPGSGSTADEEIPGASPAVPPGDLDIWVAQASGDGTQSVLWTPSDGRWAAVVMNADGSRGVSASVDVGARLPWLGGAGFAAFTVGLVLLIGGVALVAAGVHRASRTEP